LDTIVIIIVVVFSVVVLILTGITSVNKFSKKLLEDPLKKHDKTENN